MAAVVGSGVCPAWIASVSRCVDWVFMGAQYTDGHEIGYDTGMARPLTLDALRLDTTAWTVLRDSPSLRAWRLPSGDGVAAEIFDRPPDLRAQSITTLRDQFRER